jgi:hypothetical protein
MLVPHCPNIESQKMLQELTILCLKNVERWTFLKCLNRTAVYVANNQLPNVLLSNSSQALHEIPELNDFGLRSALRALSTFSKGPGPSKEI